MPEVQPQAVSNISCVEARPPVWVCSCVDEDGETSWIHLAGELDLATLPELRETLGVFRLRARLVVLDMRELVFIDSRAVKEIADASIRARQVGRRLVLVRGPVAVDRVFELTGCAEHVEVIDLAAALPAVQGLVQLAEAERAG